ncbi:MAG: acetylxylan esterase [Chthoniobacterales bacterium]
MPREMREPGLNGVEIMPQYSYVSAGTELAAIQRFRSQEKSSNKSHTLGYSQCGVVSRAGKNVEGIVPGDRVVAIGAGAFHAERTIVAKNLVMPVPDTVSLPVAAMMAMHCFALEGVYKAAPRIGENVIVAGGGMIGQITARLFELAGCRVCVFDTNEYRLGFLPPRIPGFLLSDGALEKIKTWAEPYGIETASICFGGDATDTLEAIKPLMSLAPDGVPHGKIIFPGGAKITVLMASNMGNIRLISSAKAGPGYRDANFEAGAEYPLTYVPWTVRRNMETLLGLIGDGRLSGLEHLITHRFAFKNGLTSVASGTTALKNGEASIPAKLDEAGFLLCKVSVSGGEKPLKALAGATFDPQEIQPSLGIPEDFAAFWKEPLKRLQEVPKDFKLTPVPSPQPGLATFDLQGDCLGAPVSGYYARPVEVKKGGLPAILRLHGAGVKSGKLNEARDRGTKNAWCRVGRFTKFTGFAGRGDNLMVQGFFIW